jgi:DNA-binding transcriptional LysR family regulator
VISKEDKRSDPAVATGTPQLPPDDVVLNPVRLTVFCTVVEQRSFARAAEMLGLTPPAVSLHVRALEKLWGTALFDRRRRGGHLTEAGQIVYDYSVGVVRSTASVRARLADLAAGRAGKVVLGTQNVHGIYVLPKLLAQFRRQHPGAELELQIRPPEELGLEVLRGALAVAIVSESPPLPAEVVAELLWVDSLVLVANPAHPLVGQGPLPLAALADAEFVIGGRPTIGDRLVDGRLAQAGLPARRVVLKAGLQEGAKQAAREGVGLAILFRCVVAADLAAGHLVELPLEGPPLLNQTRLIYRQAHRFSPLCVQLIRFLQAQSHQFVTGRDL